MLNPTCGPLMHSSPLLLGGKASPVPRSTTLNSVLAMASPQEPGTVSQQGVIKPTGDSSVIPQPVKKEIRRIIKLRSTLNANTVETIVFNGPFFCG